MSGLNPLDQIQMPVILAVVAIVAVTFFVLRRVFFAPYIHVMERREERLESAEDVIAEGEALAAASEPEAARIVAEAREKADEIIRSSREEDEAYRSGVLDAAMRESSSSLEAGRAELRAVRDEEIATLRQQAIECVTLACAKVLGGSEPDAVAAAVDKLLARRVL